VTVAEVLKDAGYICGMFGKWGLGEPNTTGEPNSQGFDEWFGFLNQRHAHTHYPDYLWENRDTFYLKGNHEQRYQHTHELFTDRAVQFITENKDTSFFLYLPYTLPHAEFAATERFLDIYKDSSWTEREKTYAAMVTMVDDGLRQIMDALKTNGISDNTLLMFCSDNGAADRYDGTFNSSGELRGRKRDMYEGGIRTPMIARWPDKITAGSRSDLVWYFPDVLPTFAELAGANPPVNIDGISIVPELLGEKMEAPERFLYWEFHEGAFYQAVRWKNWKGIREGLEGMLELYKLETDISEKNDISDKHLDVVQVIKEYLEGARTGSEYWKAY
ncbi:MAG: sulfatase-like hydrolase/transferase, partial [Bacteroidales bacterium]